MSAVRRAVKEANTNLAQRYPNTLDSGGRGVGRGSKLALFCAAATFASVEGLGKVRGRGMVECGPLGDVRCARDDCVLCCPNSTRRLRLTACCFDEGTVGA